LIDRGLLGFICIILVVATVLSILVFSHEDKDSIRVLASRTPANIAGSRPGTPSYSFEMMATRDLPDVVVKTFFLVRSSPPVSVPWADLSNVGVVELIGNVPRLSEIKARLDNLTAASGLEAPYNILQFEPELGGVLHLFDFTDAVEAIAGADQIDDQYTAYAMLVDEGGRVTIYAGYRDFFFRRSSVITEVSYWTGNVSRCFRSRRAQGMLGSCETMANAPMGIIHLRDVVRNQRLRVDVSLDTYNMFGHSGILQIVTTETGMERGPSIINLIGSRGT
jgi:hypothetical protein